MFSFAHRDAIPHSYLADATTLFHGPLALYRLCCPLRHRYYGPIRQSRTLLTFAVIRQALTFPRPSLLSSPCLRKCNEITDTIWLRAKSFDRNWVLRKSRTVVLLNSALKSIMANPILPASFICCFLSNPIVCV